MADVRPPLGVLFGAFGLSATVTPVGGAPVAASVAWIETRPTVGALGLTQMGGAAVTELRRRLTLRKDQVATLPIGSRIDAPELAGGPSTPWRADRVDDFDPELLRVVVSPAPGP